MQDSLIDPYRADLLRAGADLPDRMKALADPLSGDPAFDPEEIRRMADSLPLPHAPDHPFLEKAVRVGLAHIDATFEGDHPKYGVGRYADPVHDGFPPTIIAAVDALTLWGQTDRAEALFSYWLRHFVREDGSIRYYGPSLSEYGQLLTAARRIMERGCSPERLREFMGPLGRLARCVGTLMGEAGPSELLKGVPEADELEQPAAYFHNNAWIVRGLEDWVFVREQTGLGGPAEVESHRRDADRLKRLLLDGLEESWAEDEGWWLRPMRGEDSQEGYWARPEGRVTGNRLGSYTNYRYWPELLSSGVLPRRWQERIVEARLQGGGQYLGMTRFEGHLDDWPLMDYLEGLWMLGRAEDYRISLWGHLYYHQAEGHMTAYEQVSFPPGRRLADYCLPCQLVAVRAIPRLMK